MGAERGCLFSKGSYIPPREVRRRAIGVVHLVFDPDTKRLVVRHEWTTAGHSGVAEFDVAEFLKKDGGEQAACELIRLIGGLFKAPAYA